MEFKLTQALLITPKETQLDFKVLRSGMRIEGKVADSIENFGQYFLIYFKHTNRFYCSNIVQTLHQQFMSCRSKLFSHLISLTQSQRVFPTDEGMRDYVYCQLVFRDKIFEINEKINNDFIGKYQDIDQDQENFFEEVPVDDLLPMVVHDSKASLIFNPKDADRVPKYYLDEGNKCQKLKVKIKCSIGGPYGFKNILGQEADNLIMIDDSGIWAVFDLANHLIRSTLKSQKEGTDLVVSHKFSLIYFMKSGKLNRFNSSLFALFYLEKHLQRGIIQNLLYTTSIDEVSSYFNQNYEVLKQNQCFIAAEHTNAQNLYKIARTTIDKKTIFFL